MTTYKFPQVSASNSGNVVFSRVQVVHPQKAHMQVGALLVKRVVTHVVGGVEKADVMKMGFCVKCSAQHRPYTSTQANQARLWQHRKFVQKCLPDAVDGAGNLKSGYECTGDDLKYFKASLGGF